MLRALTIFVFVALAAENYADVPFGGHWETWFKPIGELLYRASPVKAPSIALLVLFLLYKANKSSGAKTGRVAMLDNTLWLNFGALIAVFVWGMLRGGALTPALLQIQVLLFLPFCGLLFSAVLRTEADFEAIGKAILYAALYRGCLVLYYGLVVAPSLGLEPATMTTHADTILFSSAIVMLLAWALEQPTRKTLWRAGMLVAFLLVVVHVNNRRLAYVCVGGSVLVLYLMLDHPRLKRRVNKLGLLLTPLLALYVAVGWGSNSPIFKPVKAISSMVGDQQDSSSQTRDIENYNLIVTLKPNIVTGLGWGHEYNEVSVAYSIKDIFPIYRYIPHNSLLGLYAFSGYLGTTAWLLCLVVTTYLAARAYKFARTPLARTVCSVAVCEVVIYLLQGYGDMGLVAWVGNITLGVAFAAASRMAAFTGAFPATGQPMMMAEHAAPAE